MDRVWSVALVALLAPLVVGACRAEAQSEPEPALAPSPAAHTLTPLPAGRALANLSADACLSLLGEHGVTFDLVPPQDAPGVRTPIRVRGPIGGVLVVPRNDPEHSPHALLDCRLALALLAWAPTLRAAHIAKIEHYSAYRANARVGGSGPTSGHASAMAVDVARFHLDDGTTLDVLVDWADRTRGADPCAPREDEPAGSQVLRRVVCEAIRTDLFQVVLTPHHDAAHQNHVHVELRPDVDWSFVR
jgi:hypothetical protein